MKMADLMKYYDKYLKEQAARLDLDTVAKKAPELCDELRQLGDWSDSTEEWLSAASRAIGMTVEYINLCVHMCRTLYGERALVIPEVVDAAVALSRLKDNILSIEDYDMECADLVQRINRILDCAGSCLQVQDEGCWLYISELFGLDGDGALGRALAHDCANAEGETFVTYRGMTVSQDEDIARSAIEALKLANARGLDEITLSFLQRTMSCGIAVAVKILAWLECKGYIGSLMEELYEGRLDCRSIRLSSEEIAKL